MSGPAPFTAGDNAAGRRVLLALSGGVDSAVCAELLRRQGYAVQALFICFSPAHEASIPAAESAARELSLPLTIAHCEGLFEEAVVRPFCAAYAAGRTPNPCVVCNPLVKFQVLAGEADRLGIRAIASGHYARVVQAEGIHWVARAQSPQRDQSYMLYRLPQAILSRLLLPAGEMEKPAIRALARQLGLSASNAPDSQEICFIPDGDYPAFLEGRGCAGKPGRFIGPDGRDLGPHRGVHHYTVGQRRGLGIALGRPVFVRAIGAEGDVRLDFLEEAFRPSVHLTEVVLTAGGQLPGECRCQAKIRSMARPAACRALPAGEGGLTVHFDEPQRAPAPGQHTVLYTDDGRVMGGGVICPTDEA